jgi:hypothetical protein
MKRILVVIVISLAVWKISTWPVFLGWGGNHLSGLQGTSTTTAVSPSSASPFKCDGRKYCSQMTSCTEAKGFLQNCPGVEMDGDNDGVPCESQWCQ